MIQTNSIPYFNCSSTEENLGPKWRKWITRLNQYFVVSGITDDNRKLNTLFFLGGEKLYEIYETLENPTFPNDIDTDYKKVTHYFTPS